MVSFKAIALPTVSIAIVITLFLEAKAKRFPLIFCYHFQEHKRATTIVFGHIQSLKQTKQMITYIISTVSFKAITLPTIILAIVVTLLAHRGESKNICVSFCYRL